MDVALAARLATEREATIVAAIGCVCVQAGETGQAPGHRVGAGAQSRRPLSDDELGGEDVSGGHHVSPNLRTILNLEGETRVMVAMLALAVITTQEQVTLITLPRSLFMAEKASAQQTTRHCFHPGSNDL